MPKSLRAAAASHAALALTLAASMLQAAPASAATRTPYQKQVFLTCSQGKCTGAFPQLGAKQRLELEQVICRTGLGSASHAYDVHLSYETSGGLRFYYPLALDSKTYSGANTYIYVFGQDGLFLVPQGKLLEVQLSFNGSVGGATHCSAHGRMITQ